MADRGEPIDPGTAADSLLEPVFAVRDGTIRYGNDRFYEVFDTAPEAVVGADLARFERYVDDGFDAFRAAVDAVADGTADERRVELVMVHPDGAPVPRRLPAEARLTPLETDGVRAGVVVSLRDIAERRAREDELERQRARLEEFASVVSHDLRNPLNVAQGSLELARETGDDASLERVDRAHRRMAELIEDLLALGRAGASPSPEPVDLASLTTACWSTVETADATLEVATDATVMADPRALRRLLENLIRNAVQHAGPDVTVTVGALPDGFFVADDGPGIDPDRREAVLTAGVSASESGPGIGLTIVSEIAMAHGWSVTVTAGAAGGARFEFAGVETPD